MSDKWLKSPFFPLKKCCKILSNLSCKHQAILRWGRTGDKYIFFAKIRKWSPLRLCYSLRIICFLVYWTKLSCVRQMIHSPRVISIIFLEYRRLTNFWPTMFVNLFSLSIFWFCFVFSQQVLTWTETFNVDYTRSFF